MRKDLYGTVFVLWIVFCIGWFVSGIDSLTTYFVIAMLFHMIVLGVASRDAKIRLKNTPNKTLSKGYWLWGDKSLKERSPYYKSVIHDFNIIRIFGTVSLLGTVWGMTVLYLLLSFAKRISG